MTDYGSDSRGSIHRRRKNFSYLLLSPPGFLFVGCLPGVQRLERETYHWPQCPELYDPFITRLHGVVFRPRQKFAYASPSVLLMTANGLGSGRAVFQHHTFPETRISVKCKFTYIYTDLCFHVLRTQLWMNNWDKAPLIMELDTRGEVSNELHTLACLTQAKNASSIHWIEVWVIRSAVLCVLTKRSIVASV